MNCSTCVHWTDVKTDEDTYKFDIPDPHQEIEPFDLDVYTTTKEVEWGTAWGTCRRQHEPGSPMFTNDASHYFSALRTKPDFGCTAHQPKDDQ